MACGDDVASGGFGHPPLHTAAATMATRRRSAGPSAAQGISRGRRGHDQDPWSAPRLGPGGRSVETPSRFRWTSRLCLIHWPDPASGGMRRRGVPWWTCGNAAWSGLSAGATSPRSTSDEVIDDTGVTPAGGQIELHPYFAQTDASVRAPPWDPDRVVEPAREMQRPVRRAPVTTGCRGPRRDRAGDPALATSARRLPLPKSATTGASTAELEVFGSSCTKKTWSRSRSAVPMGACSEATRRARRDVSGLWR